MSLTRLLVPTYVQMLNALRGWLEKAQAQMGEAEAEALLSARLASDMFPLSTQVRFACVQALEASYRLRNEVFPNSVNELLDEGRNAGDQPGSIQDSCTRINETIAMLEKLNSTSLDVDSDTPIAHELANGMIFDFTAEQYARDWTLGQFYFHIMIAYAILRNQRVDLGKADYIPHMLQHIRSEASSDY